ncbi:phage antitermination protein [Acetobacter orientalis]|uniref:Phage antitermination protein n=1 Tax=Acetobacter orientalis TaxID=146474 RepID=A0A2Z5ZLA5_9PROT|nr:phage antitermination protein [Acetobacter orientalis]
MVVTSGYSVELRAKIIDRWLELETKPALTEETPEMLAFRAIIALQGKLEVSEERGKLQAAMLEAAQPKAKALDTLAGMRGFHSLTQAAKSCSWPRDAFIEECNRIKWIYRDKAKEIWMGYSEKERAGYLDYKPFQYTNSDGKLIKKPQVVFTDKGLAKICEIFAYKEKPAPFTKTPAKAA